MIGHTLSLTPAVKSHVFISYSRADGAGVASKLEADLHKNGIATWRDRLVRPGVPFGAELKLAIDNSFAMVALITREACRSYWVRCEWCYALARRDVTIVPVVIQGFDENLFPFELFPMARIYLTEEYESSLENIITFLDYAKANPPIW